jgi:hypothetical protein
VNEGKYIHKDLDIYGQRMFKQSDWKAQGCKMERALEKYGRHVNKEDTGKGVARFWTNLGINRQ